MTPPSTAPAPRIVCVAGNPSIDKLFVVDRLTVGDIHRPLELVQVPGGKGLNVARAAAALGAAVAVVGILGGHAGRWIEEALATEGVPGQFAWSTGETRTSLSVADRETRRLTEFYESGARIDGGSWEELESVATPLLAGAAWVTLSGSLPPGTPVDGYARLIRAAHEAGARTALDARGPALAAGIEAGPDLVKVNADEAAELLGSPIDTEEAAVVAAEELRRRAGGRGAGIVTRGVEGCVVVPPAGSPCRGRIDAWGPYPVGSGDAFLAAAVTALSEGRAWPEALRVALGAAAANAEVPGAGRLERGRAVVLASRAVLTPLA